MSKEKLVVFTDKEARWDYYPMFLNLMAKGFEIEAFVFILATWNFARFRYVMRNFDLESFENTVKKLTPLFQKMKDEEFSTMNIDNYSRTIKVIFKTLADIKGIEATGAPKLMHLKLPKVFVMWDKRIRESYGYMMGDADDYVSFLKDMQKRFSRTETKLDRTLAKLIDENNYIKITMPALRKKKNNKNE